MQNILTLGLFLSCLTYPSTLQASAYVRKEIPEHLAKLIVDPKKKVHRDVPKITPEMLKPPARDPYRKKLSHEIPRVPEHKYTVEDLEFHELELKEHHFKQAKEHH